MGAPSRARLAPVYTIAAAIAGLAGGVLAQTTQLVYLGALSFDRSAELVVIVVLGGTGIVYGGGSSAPSFTWWRRTNCRA